MCSLQVAIREASIAQFSAPFHESSTKLSRNVPGTAMPFRPVN